MNYQKIYDQIIERAKNRHLEGYKEKHHIKPKCIGGDDFPNNIVELTAREHFLCHRLLCEIYPNNDKLWYALWLMIVGKNRQKSLSPYVISSRTYEKVKLEFIEKIKGISRPSNKGRKVTWGDKISESKKNSTYRHPKEIMDKIAQTHSKPIEQYTPEGILLNTFPSAMEAMRQTGVKNDNINQNLRGKSKSAGGFVWKYK